MKGRLIGNWFENDYRNDAAEYARLKRLPLPLQPIDAKHCTDLEAKYAGCGTGTAGLLKFQENKENQEMGPRLPHDYSTDAAEYTRLKRLPLPLQPIDAAHRTDLEIKYADCGTGTAGLLKFQSNQEMGGRTRKVVGGGSAEVQDGSFRKRRKTLRQANRASEPAVVSRAEALRVARRGDLIQQRDQLLLLSAITTSDFARNLYTKRIELLKQQIEGIASSKS
jgi:hypothetical protein